MNLDSFRSLTNCDLANFHVKNAVFILTEILKQLYQSDISMTIIKGYGLFYQEELHMALSKTLKYIFNEKKGL